MNGKENKLIAILGPTASGKTKIAAHVAHEINGEVISADSRQVYQDMNLGTGKDYEDYQVNGTMVPYHLIDIRNPGEKYNVYEYQKDFLNAYKMVSEKKKIPVLCGGSGMYIEAVTKGYRLIQVPVDQQLRTELEMKSHAELINMLRSMKDLHNVSDIDTKKRTIRAIEIQNYYVNHPEIQLDFPTFTPFFIGIMYQRENERKNITGRLKDRLENGMIDEVKRLYANGLKFKNLTYYGLEYKFIAMHLEGSLTYEEMFKQLNTAIHQFAKRQRTWFRKMEREGSKIHWIEGELPFQEKISKAMDLTTSFLLTNH